MGLENFKDVSGVVLKGLQSKAQGVLSTSTWSAKFMIAWTISTEKHAVY